jgi:colanic acid biosynthesis glycosyl transferase WcaI
VKILILSINFYPEPTGIGKYTGEMAQWFAEKGHEVRIITSYPYYPQWKIDPNYRKLWWSKQKWMGIEIWRCPLWVPRVPSGIKRLLHLFSFACSSFFAILWQLFWRPNIVLSIEPPLFLAPAALFLSSLARCPSILHIQDYEVDAAFELGIVNGAFLRRWMLVCEKWLLERFDLVSTISNRMAQKASQKKVKQSNIFLLPNWVDLSAFPRIDEGNLSHRTDAYFKYRKSLNITADEVVIMYSGSMGEKQGLELLAYAARSFYVNVDFSKKVRFIFCGAGGGRAKLEKMCEGLGNVLFLELQSEKSLPNFLSLADIHVLPQRPGVADLVMPSKLTGMMASGRPVVICANKDTELADVVKSCGLVVSPDTPSEFVDALLSLVSNKSLRDIMGFSGYCYAEKYLSREVILSTFEIRVNKLIYGA